MEPRVLLSGDSGESLVMLGDPSHLMDSMSMTADDGHDHGGGASDPVVSTAVYSVADGLWSDPNTWHDGHVPTAVDDVTITHNVVIDQGHVRQLDINAGVTTLTGTLHAHGSIIVRAKLMASQGLIAFHVADDRLFTGNTAPGPDLHMPDFHPEDIGLWVMPNGEARLVGEEVTSWVNVAAVGAVQWVQNGLWRSLAFDAHQATLSTVPVGWRVGDTLLLVNEQGQDRLARLESISGNQITYQQLKDQPEDPDLIGHVLLAGSSQQTVHPKIANLSRRLQIVAVDVKEGDTHHRAHVTVMHHGHVHLEHVEFRNLGPRDKFGRYPIHFHHTGHGHSTLIGSAIWQDVTEGSNRFVAVHNSQGVKVNHNVGYRAEGHGFFFEDRNEYNNELIGNLSVHVMDGEVFNNVDMGASHISHHFWVRAGNTISGNVAAGGTAIGIILLGSKLPGGQALVVDQENLGTGKYSAWAAVPDAKFVNLVSVHGEQSGFGVEPTWGIDAHRAVLINPLLLLNGEASPTYSSQIYVNNGRGIEVTGGVLVGDKGVHIHYRPTLVMRGTEMYLDTVLTPTYWEMGVLFEQTQIVASHWFDLQYAPRVAAPGVFRVVDSLVQVGADPQQLLTADFVGKAWSTWPGFAGTDVGNGIRLAGPLPTSGFLRSEIAGARYWSVTPEGQATRPRLYMSENETSWSGDVWFSGYPQGFLPGSYNVKLYDLNGKLLHSTSIEVHAGTIARITAARLGDANGDGLVTAADYTVWATNHGFSGPGGNQVGDFNGDGLVSTADYTVWADHFDNLPTAAPVPAALQPAAVETVDAALQVETTLGQIEAAVDSLLLVGDEESGTTPVDAPAQGSRILPWLRLHDALRKPHVHRLRAGR